MLLHHHEGDDGDAAAAAAGSTWLGTWHVDDDAGRSLTTTGDFDDECFLTTSCDDERTIEHEALLV